MGNPILYLLGQLRHREIKAIWLEHRIVAEAAAATGRFENHPRALTARSEGLAVRPG